MRGFLLLALAVCLLGGCGGGGDAPGAPQTFVVTSADDAGPGTLRDLLATAPAGSTITFEPGLPDIVLTSGVLNVDRSLTVQGPGASSLSVLGGGSIDLLVVQPGATFTIRDLTLGNSGQGLVTMGTAFATRVVFDGCGGTFGGAFEVQAETLTLTDCLIRNCSAFNGGGGGVNEGSSLLARRCTWHGNVTTGNSGAGLVLVDATAVLVNCTFSLNTATGSGAGGAIGAFDSDTISNLTLIHCTFTQNDAGGDGGALIADSANLVCRGCILAGNTAGGTGPDVSFIGVGTFTTEGWNVVGIGAGSPFVDGVMNDQVGSLAVPLDPMLGALADNGGETPTHALLPASPALDQVPAASCLDESGQPLDHDQRESVRPGGALCDVGAFEL